MRALSELMDLRGRVALITGGGGHVGRAIGEALAEQGAIVALLDFDAAAAERAVDRLRVEYGATATGLIVDLRDEDATRAAPAAVLEKYGRLDILVNCAALVGTSGLEDLTAPFPKQGTVTWRLALEVNLTAAFVLSQASSEALSAGGRGSIINVSSIYGMVGSDMSLYEGTTMGSSAAYGVSKGGIIQLTRWLATMLAPAVRVNAITPGGILRGQPEPFRKRYVDRTPMRRMAVEEDFKGAAAYLASDLSAYVTGQNLVVDGGWTIW
ncbi:MAG: SDR family oxidoreductase [Candidatus Latescibacterota bacterium]|nr:SDR family oxidoreductase [Candidatus Latescibacterota bacterium]